MPSPTSPQQQQFQQNNGSVASAMLNTLMRHLQQQNKVFASSTAAVPTATAMPTFPAAHPATTTTMSCCCGSAAAAAVGNVHNDSSNIYTANVPSFCDNNFQQRHTNGGDEVDTTTAFFAKTVDSLQNFLSPNVVLLPVAFHSLADEQHVQLLGMPQTVIPIAIHPVMHKLFTVRPLLVDPTMARHNNGGPFSSCSATVAKVPQQIAIGRIGGGHNDNNSCELSQREQQFQLPVAFRASFADNNSMPAHSHQQPHQTNSCAVKGNSHHQMNHHHHYHQFQPSCATAVVAIEKFEYDDKNGVGGGTTEPLDLSRTTAQTKNNEQIAVNGAGGVQRRKRTAPKGPTDEMGETAANKRGKATPEAVLVEKRSSPPSVASGAVSVATSMPSSSSSSSCTFVPPLVPFSCSSPSVVAPIASSSASANAPPRGSTLSAASVTAPPPLLPVDSAARKRFLCDLCGDVSFSQLETLIGHQQYYCRNRPRLIDEMPSTDSVCPSSSASRQLTTMSNNAGASCATALNISLSLKKGTKTVSPSAVSPPTTAFLCAQCPFQAATHALLGQHHKQQHALPVICADCGYRAFTVRGLRTHARLSHSASTNNSTAATAAVQTAANKKTTANSAMTPGGTDGIGIGGGHDKM